MTRSYKQLSGHDIDFVRQNFHTMSRTALAAHIGCSPETIKKLTKKLGFYKIGPRKLYFSRENMVDELAGSIGKFGCYKTYVIIDYRTGTVFEVGEVKTTLEDTAAHIFDYGTGRRRPDSRYEFKKENVAAYLLPHELKDVGRIKNLKAAPPKLSRKLTLKEKEEIVKLKEDGRSGSELAKIYSLNLNTVYKIVRQYKKNGGKLI